MGKNAPGNRDGTGPAAGSFQRRTSGNIGRRKAAGQKCPKATPKGTKKRS